MDKQQLVSLIRRKKSFLCVGLDTDIEKIPLHILDEEDPVFHFNREIIDATLPYAVAYKPNMAFYESQGSAGWKSLEKTMEYLRQFRQEAFLIADAKRGDIGNTSERYAKAFLDHLHFDAITVAPYMGHDSVKPFLIDGKWVILLALTSNPGASDFETLNTDEGKLFERVLKTSKLWADSDQLMYVVGATQANSLKNIRKIVPDHFLLVPGVGAQGGSLKEVATSGLNKDIGLLINASRSIIYASSDRDFAGAAATEAQKLQERMAAYI